VTQHVIDPITDYCTGCGKHAGLIHTAKLACYDRDDKVVAISHIVRAKAAYDRILGERFTMQEDG
jgi:hypothetical protein